MKTKLMYLLLPVFFTSCAISRKVEYNKITADIPEVSAALTIATWDQRPQILSGERKPDFVGYMRSAAGIPYAMGTESKQDLVSDISASISSSFEEKGVSSATIATAPSDKDEEIIDKFRGNESNKLLLIKCNKYHTDGYGLMLLEYNLEVGVYAKNGELIGSKTFEGKRKLGGSVMWGPGKYKRYMPEGLKTLLEEIFNDPVITAALNGKEQLSPMASKSVAELQQMKEVAVAEENFRLAAEIQQELKSRTSSANIIAQKEAEMHKAAGEGDYARAAELKEEVEKLKAGESESGGS